MQSRMTDNVLGYVELEIGSLKVEVPIRSARGGSAAEPIARFEMEGDACAILVRGDPSSKQAERAMQLAAREAVRQLSRKLLN